MTQIPDPPPGVLSLYDKSIRNDHFRTKGPMKRKRRPLDDRDWYVAVFIDDEGQYEICSSSTMSHVADTLMKVPAEGLLREYRALQACPLKIEDSQQSQMKSLKQHTGSVKSRVQPDAAFVSVSSGGSVSYPFRDKSRPTYGSFGQAYGVIPMAVSHYSGSLGTAAPHSKLVSDVGFTDLPKPRPMLEIKMGEAEKWNAWFNNAFFAVQQQACRFIAKEWIKLIHPKKQSTHPYNGKIPRTVRGSSDQTKPPYWPPDVIHKEPDHISRENRIALLVWLLVHTPQPEITPRTVDGKTVEKQIVAKDMLNTLTKKKEEFKKKWEIIRCIVEVRTSLENFEEGGCDADAVLNVPDYQEPVKPRSSTRKPRPKLPPRPERDSGSDDEQSNAETPTAPGSPMGSVTTQAYSDDDEDDDSDYGVSVVNDSFDSDMTRDSSKSSNSSTQLMPMSLDNGFSDHVPLNAGQSMLFDPRQSVPPPWSAPHTTNAPLQHSYRNRMAPQAVLPMLDSATYYPELYSTTRAANSGQAMMPAEYYSLGSEYAPEVSRRVTFSTVSNMNHVVDLEPEYPLHENFDHTFVASTQPPSQ